MKTPSFTALHIAMVLLTFVPARSSAQSEPSSPDKVYLLDEASESFDLKITVPHMHPFAEDGKNATVEIFRKGERTKPVETLSLPSLHLTFDENEKPTTGENHTGVIFGDFNFDGAEDIALKNGNEGNRNSASYDVFLQLKETGKFRKSPELTGLSAEGIGMFEVIKDEKILQVNYTAAAYIHVTLQYKLIDDRPEKVRQLTITDNGETVTLTTETLIEGKWTKETKEVPAKDYYKE